MNIPLICFALAKDIYRDSCDTESGWVRLASSVVYKQHWASARAETEHATLPFTTVFLPAGFRWLAVAELLCWMAFSRRCNWRILVVSLFQLADNWTIVRNREEDSFCFLLFIRVTHWCPEAFWSAQKKNFPTHYIEESNGFFRFFRDVVCSKFVFSCKSSCCFYSPTQFWTPRGVWFVRNPPLHQASCIVDPRNIPEESLATFASRH